MRSSSIDLMRCEHTLLLVAWKLRLFLEKPCRHCWLGSLALPLLSEARGVQQHHYQEEKSPTLRELFLTPSDIIIRALLFLSCMQIVSKTDESRKEQCSVILLLFQIYEWHALYSSYCKVFSREANSHLQCPQSSTQWIDVGWCWHYYSFCATFPSLAFGFVVFENNGRCFAGSALDRPRMSYVHVERNKKATNHFVRGWEACSPIVIGVVAWHTKVGCTVASY